MVSGLALACAPRAAGALYGLPRSVPLLRALGARDVAVGLLMLSPGAAHVGCALRAASDGLDLALIAGAALRGRRSRALAPLRLAGAALLVASAARLALELRAGARDERFAVR